MAVEVAAAAVAFPVFPALPALVVTEEVATAAAAAPPMFSTARVWTGAALDVTVRPRSAEIS